MAGRNQNTEQAGAVAIRKEPVSVEEEKGPAEMLVLRTVVAWDAYEAPPRI